jgi:amidase/aspartyl-tRNA(Asn)/glutamyl-tRNA(Gln) amidotransferase subunit A
MSLADELAYVSAADLAESIRTRTLSPVEVVDAFIERIQIHNGRYNALVYFGFEDARAKAREAEAAVMRGDRLGAFHGVPIAMKDGFDFKPGWPSTFGGVRALKNNIADNYCLFTERMEKAGAIILGKTNAPTFGFRGTCDNFMFGPTRNPFDLSRNSGGSSGGSAAAVAAGLLPLAEGTDGGGSIRIPASWCGVYGYKASFGRIPVTGRPNGFGHMSPFIFEGPITRTVKDAALALGVLAGADDRDPYSLPDAPEFLGALDRPIKGMKIAYTPDYGIFPVDRQVRDVVEKALEAFREAGAEVEPVDLGIRHDQRELSDLWCRILSPANVQALDDFKAAGIDLLGTHREDFPPELLAWIEKARTLSAVSHFKDQAVRTEVYDAIQKVFVTHDLLVSPTLACLPVLNADNGNTVGPSEIEGVAVDPLIGWCMTYLINFTGNPAATIPAGFAAGNLPVGMQIVGRRFADGDVLAASAAFERLRPWAQSYKLCQ